ncbi:calmodulin-binding protein 60 A-like [Momordica charantia]|uniref:Calmodulin-binding protein 60 A-like n=1 Tax=Momordica charantia TaxID=3673 RepID=A0A6J1DZG9_MOMCH|nr:calmodulin-binding protein 60 A-like [Momordica charantia]
MDRGNKRDLPNLVDDKEPRKRIFCCCCGRHHSLKSQAVLEADDHVEPVSAEDLQTAQRNFHIAIGNYYNSTKLAVPILDNIRLKFLKRIAPRIYTGNDIVAMDGKPLEVSIIGGAGNLREIIKTGPFSQVKVEILVLPGDHKKYEKISENDVLFQREGRRPLIVGDDQKIHLKDGIGLIKNLSFTDNSSWTKSKTFRIAVKVIDEGISAQFPKIEEAISEPIRVFDQRGEANKKHCHPKEEDEVWRLKGISKNGKYHSRLLSKDIKTVGDFLKIHAEMGDDYLKKLLGNKVPKKTWNMMVHNALGCISQKVPNETMKNASPSVLVTSFNPSTIEEDSVRNEAMGVALNHNFTLQDLDYLLFEGVVTDNFSLLNS